MDSYNTSADWSADLTSLCPAFDSDCFTLDSSTEQMIANLYPSPPLYKADELQFDDHHLASAHSQPQLRRARSSVALTTPSSLAGSAVSGFPMTTPSSSWSGSPNSDLSLHTPSDGRKMGYFGAPASPVSPVYGRYPEYPAVASTSYLPASQPMAPSASIEEVNQFLNDMTTLLGKDAMSSISPSQLQGPSVHAPTLAQSQSSVSPVQHQHQHHPRKASYNVSGVLLDEDDLAAFSSPSASNTSSYHQSYLKPSFAPVPHQPYGYYPEPSSYTYSAHPPRTPTRSSFSVQRPRQLRRPSSMELLQALPRSAPVYRPNQPYPQDLVGMGVYLPVEPTSPTPAPQMASNGGPQRTVRKMASMPNTRVARKPTGPPPPVPSIPKVVRKQASLGSCFINFSASDSKALLSGVAPSGSSKRKRDTDKEADEGDKKPKA